MQVRLPAIGLVAVPHHICRTGNVWLAMNGSPEDELGVGYKAPVQQLLSIGETRSYNPSEWPDYCARFGLEREHVGDLIRMACDAALNQAESTSSKVWAPMHAWRALGQMRAEQAVLPLLAHLRAAEDAEAGALELPAVVGVRRPGAISPPFELPPDRAHPGGGVS